MITFSNLGKRGNLGNQLFQIASTVGIAVKNDHAYCFPNWEYQKYFKHKLPSYKEKEYCKIEERYFSYHDIDFKQEKNYDISGWFQTEKYFQNFNIKEYFEFETGFINNIRHKFQNAFSKKTILISIRRGDFVNHPDYFQLSIQYYILALITYFPDWERRNIVVLSDDIKYCKFHFSFLKNVFFAEKFSGIEQLCLGTLCDDFIISNSTFSWWTAWLGEKKESKIIRPLHNFSEDKRKVDNDKDYYPERWICFNHQNLKINLYNTAFYSKSKIQILNSYLNFIFDIDLKNLSEINLKKQIIFNFIGNIPPPLSIIHAYNLALENKVGIKGIEIGVFKIFKKGNYQLFFPTQDFGIFSIIFQFKKLLKSSKTTFICLNSESEIFKNALDEKKDFSFLETNNNLEFITFYSGKFVALFGFKFQYLRAKKKIFNNLKRIVKQIFRISKKQN